MKKISKAMILAAGFGTRLKPLTDSVPKALVKINGVPMIDIVIKRLADYGIKEIIVNTHYLSGQVEKYFSGNNFGVKIILSLEDKILGTGGGIKNAERFLNNTEAFIVHNVDVLSEINFEELVRFHYQNSAFATLAVKRRDTSRPLIIDGASNIIGRKSPEKSYRYKNPEGAESLVGFCGIHIISSSIFKNFSETDFFDIFTAYFRLIGQNKKIIAYNSGECLWQDLGKPDENIVFS